MVLAWLLLAAIAVMGLFPGTEIGKSLHRWLVVAPASWLNGFSWRRALLVSLAAPAVVLIALAAPELMLAMAALGDVMLLVEVSLIVWASLQAQALAAGWREVTGRMRLVMQTVQRRMAAARARRRPRRPRPARPRSAIDTEPGLVWA